MRSSTPTASARCTRAGRRSSSSATRASTGARSGSSPTSRRQKGGVLFVDSADKAARFIKTCNAFNVPLLFLADVPGFMIGTDVERQGIIRHGAKMISAVSEATVPKISVIVRKAYGAGLYAMAGPAFEPDCCIALPRRQDRRDGSRRQRSTPSSSIRSRRSRTRASASASSPRSARSTRPTSTSFTWLRSWWSTRSSNPTSCAAS